VSKISIAIVGYGTIGSGVIQILQEQAELIKKRIGVEVSIKYVVDKDIETPRSVKLISGTLIDDYKIAINDPEIDVVVELVGGISFSYQLVEESLQAGKSIVSANKALLAERGTDLFELAGKKGQVVGFEASVAGGIPIIRTINDALAGDTIHTIYGIVNGTTNYILTKMFEEGWNFEKALKKAQELGFAEAHPTLDIEGYDAAHKIALLAALAFNTTIKYDEVSIEGITKVDLEDVKQAGEIGYIIKLLAIAKRDKNNKIELRVNPTLVPIDSQLASIKNEFNAALIDSEYLGESMYSGKGAGSLPTASAVVADILDVAKRKDDPKRTSKYISFNDFSIKNLDEIESKYYIRFNFNDQVGITNNISSIFSDCNITIASMMQKEKTDNNGYMLILTTQYAVEKNIVAALDAIQKLALNIQRGIMIRML
jgi:homoserine dehydrogenase